MSIEEYIQNMTGHPINEWQRKIIEEVQKNPNVVITMPPRIALEAKINFSNCGAGNQEVGQRSAYYIP